MKVLQHFIEPKHLSAEHRGLEHNALSDSAIIFDIETLGLSANSSGIYLISAGFWDGGFVLEQYFDDDGLSESLVIEAFFNLLKKRRCTSLFSFNGNRFDIPFVNKRATILNIKERLNKIISVDLYKQGIGRLVEVESKMGIGRPAYFAAANEAADLKHFDKSFDSYDITGKEGIELYNSYLLKRTSFQNSTSESIARVLLRHCFYDVLNTSILLSEFDLEKLPKTLILDNNDLLVYKRNNTPAHSWHYKLLFPYDEQEEIEWHDFNAQISITKSLSGYIGRVNIPLIKVRLRQHIILVPEPKYVLGKSLTNLNSNEMKNLITMNPHKALKLFISILKTNL